MNDYGGSLKRFWWLLAIGLVLAAAAGIVTAYKVTLGKHPELTKRSQPDYVARGRLLVTDSDLPHLRVSITTTVQRPTPAGAEPTTPVEVRQAPDIAVLGDAANYYPLEIEGDRVAAQRKKMFEDTEGIIRARAIYSIITAGRVTPSKVPVIEVSGVASSPRGAIKLVRDTNAAFIRWMTIRQDAAGIPPKERIRIETITTPVEATAFGGASNTLPVLVFIVVLAAFVPLAIVLDRLIPRRATRRARKRQSEQEGRLLAPQPPA